MEGLVKGEGVVKVEGVIEEEEVKVDGVKGEGAVKQEGVIKGVVETEGVKLEGAVKHEVKGAVRIKEEDDYTAEIKESVAKEEALVDERVKAPPGSPRIKVEEV